MKSKAPMREIYALRERMFKLMDLVPEAGCHVQWNGLMLKVGPSVFWPHEDSLALANNYHINEGDDVLDVCSGSGNLAIQSGLLGARKVVGLEHNPKAVEVARENVKTYYLENVVEIRKSDMFSALRAGEQFDVITGNLPFTNKSARSYTESTMHDDGLRAHDLFFKGVNKILRPHGSIYLAHSDIGALDTMLTLADRNGFSVSKIGEQVVKHPHMVFSAYELRRKK